MTEETPAAAAPPMARAALAWAGAAGLLFLSVALYLASDGGVPATRLLRVGVAIASAGTLAWLWGFASGGAWPRPSSPFACRSS